MRAGENNGEAAAVTEYQIALLVEQLRACMQGCDHVDKLELTAPVGEDGDRRRQQLTGNFLKALVLAQEGKAELE